MFILYGTRQKVKIVKPLRKDRCMVCNHVTEKALAKEKKSFTVFFIPLFTWTTLKFIFCPVCGRSKILTNAEYKEIKNNDMI